MARRPANRPPNLLVMLCLAGSLVMGCARPSAIRRTEATNSPANEQKLPFHENADHGSDGSAHPAIPVDPKSVSDTPFRTASRTRSLPAGTLITVRLDHSLSISKARPGDSFLAYVAGPLAVDGETLMARGTSVSGRIESAQPSVNRPGWKPDPGYLRLTLNTVTVDGKTRELQTSSLFARGAYESKDTSKKDLSKVSASDLQIQQGRRLTFRLTAPLTLADPNSVADGHDPRASAN